MSDVLAQLPGFPPMRNPVYATLAGPIDGTTINRIMTNFAGATQRGFTEAHVMVQSNGGAIGDGIAIYNLLRAFPIELHLYNGGLVASIAVIAFLGAKHRYVSAHGQFMIHKVHSSPQAGTSGAKLAAIAKGALSEDKRIEAIIKAHTTIPRAKWRAHALQDVFFSPQEAVDFGLAQAIREFDVPAGAQVFSI